MLQQDIFATFLQLVHRLEASCQKERYTTPLSHLGYKMRKQIEKFSEQRIAQLRNIFVSLISKFEAQHTSCIQSIGTLQKQQQQLKRYTPD